MLSAEKHLCRFSAKLFSEAIEMLRYAQHDDRFLSYSPPRQQPIHVVERMAAAGLVQQIGQVAGG
jgi:hypothetical protein